MCGFAGFVAFGSPVLGAEERHRVLAAMARCLAPRGPDDEQFYDDGTLSLVFRRLAIVDRKHGKQPLFNEDRRQLLVCNGEIYNHDELRCALAPRHRFVSTSDSEVVLHGFEEWSQEVFQKLRGMYAVALWNSAEKRLILARDRLGIKPLYICQLANGILFGSEIKALLAHPECPREVDWDTVQQNPMALSKANTYLKGVEALPGGNLLIAQAGKPPRIQTYWNIEDHFAAAPFGSDALRYQAEYSRLLEESVIEHLHGEADVAIHLSGGIDSSLIAAIAARHGRKFPCFTVVERTTHLAGDVRAAKEHAERLGLPWHPVHFNYRSINDDIAFSLQRFEELVWMMESSRFDLEWIVKEELNRSVRGLYPDIKVVLLGQGADEFAGGYSRRSDCLHGNWKSFLHDEIEPLLARFGQTLAPGLATHAPYHRAMKLMVRQLQFYNLWHEDRTSSLHSLEARVPFLDHRLVELLASVPVALQGRLFWNKEIVRDCFRQLDSGYDVDRTKVGFFETPDMRSIDIILHGFACSIARDFQDKYQSRPDFPFERGEFDRLVSQVLDRAPGFYRNSFILLHQMAEVIFSEQCRQGVAFEAMEMGRQRPSSVDIITASRLTMVESLFDRQPVVEYPWHPDDILALPTGGRITQNRVAPGQNEIALVVGSEIAASIVISTSQDWMSQFMRFLGTQATREFTIQDWCDEFDIGQGEFERILDVLLQCGFIATPQRFSPSITAGLAAMPA